MKRFVPSFVHHDEATTYRCLGARLFRRKAPERIACKLSNGERPMGVILYTSDGYMSAQLMRSNPGHFASADWFKATPEEYARAASTYTLLMPDLSMWMKRAALSLIRCCIALPKLDWTKAATNCENPGGHAGAQRCVAHAVRGTESKCLLAVAAYQRLIRRANDR